MLRTKVVLSHVTNLSDARYAAGMGVNFIGFVINPQDRRYVTAAEAKTIGDWLSGVSIIGATGDSLPNDLQEYDYSFIQTTNTSLVADLDNPILKLELNKANVAEVPEILSTHAASVSFFILSVDGEQLIDLEGELLKLCADYPIYIATKFDDDNLKLVVDNINPTGIVLYGSEEEKPGLSSYDGIADILEQLEEE